jgi:hypothetical protein
MIRCLLGLNDGLGQATKARRKEEKKIKKKKNFEKKHTGSLITESIFQLHSRNI